MSGLGRFIIECLIYAVVSSFRGTPAQNRMAAWGITAILLFAASFAFFLLYFFPRFEKSCGRMRHWQSVFSVVLSAVVMLLFLCMIYVFVG